MLSGLVTGHDPTRGPGEEVFIFNFLRVESGRVRRCLKSHWPSRIGPGGFQISRARPDSARTDSTRDKP